MGLLVRFVSLDSLKTLFGVCGVWYRDGRLMLEEVHLNPSFREKGKVCDDVYSLFCRVFG